MRYVLLVLAFAIVSLPATAAIAGACDWEHGGVVESSPAPCDVPVPVSVTDIDGAASDFRQEIIAGAGLSVFLLTGLVVRTFPRRRLPV